MCDVVVRCCTKYDRSLNTTADLLLLKTRLLCKATILCAVVHDTRPDLLSGKPTLATADNLNQF